MGETIQPGPVVGLTPQESRTRLAEHLKLVGAYDGPPRDYLVRLCQDSAKALLDANREIEDLEDYMDELSPGDVGEAMPDEAELIELVKTDPEFRAALRRALNLPDENQAKAPPINGQ